MKPQLVNCGLCLLLAVGCGESRPNRVASSADTRGSDRADAGSANLAPTDKRDADSTTPDAAVDDKGEESTVEGALEADSGADATPQSEQCENNGLSLSPSPLSRLSSDEINSCVQQLFPSGIQGLPWLAANHAFEHEPVPATALDLANIRALAQATAIELTSGKGEDSWLAGCDPSVQGEEECRRTLLEPMVERVFRRPLTDEDRGELLEVFELGKELGGNFESGLRAVLEVMLQGPEFLYLVEQGAGQFEEAAVQLTGHETAARLAFLLTGKAPDAELRAEADLGPMQLSTIEAHARRLITDSGNRQAISRTLRNILVSNAPAAKPELNWSAELADAVDEATLRFVESVTFNGAGTLDALLTQPTVWANASVADFYGYSINGDEWQELELDRSRAAGIFTQPAFLAATSHLRPSIVQRTLYILRTLLCFDPPSPAAFASELPEPMAGVTGRQQLEAATATDACVVCHETLNSVGFAFEHYDAVGKWRDEDNGLPIDASGVLNVTDAKGPFMNAVELMNNIVESRAANECFVQHWLERALRRKLASEDTCVKTTLTKGFEQHQGKIQELLLALVRNDHLRYRRAADLTP